MCLFLFYIIHRYFKEIYEKNYRFLSGNVIGEVGKVLDNLFTNDEERIEAKIKFMLF